MSVSINIGDQQVTIDQLKDLASNALTVFNLGKEFVSLVNQPLSAVPDNTATNVQFDSGNQTWNVNAVAFNLSGGVAGSIQVLKSGKLYDYTDEFPTEVELSLSTQDNSASSTVPFPVPSGAIYMKVELDFNIQAGVNFASAPTSFGLSFNASAGASNTFTVAFFKKCAGTDLLSTAIKQAFQDLVLPFHADTVRNLLVGDVLKHTAAASLQLGLGAGIGFDLFSVASQFQKGLEHVPGTPTLTVGFNPSAGATASLAYNFGYAGTFEQTLWRESLSSARLHLYKSKDTSHSLGFAAGISANLGLSVEASLQSQILNAPASATTNPLLQKALTAAFNAAQDQANKLVGEINDKISSLLAPINQNASVELDLSISRTRQTFLLTDYTFDLTKNFSAAWTDIVNGRFLDALKDGNGSVDLAVGSGLEKLYNQTTSISLNFFGQAAAAWSAESIQNSKLVYAGNKIFHLISADGINRFSLVEGTFKEVDFYFTLDMKLAAGGAAGSAKPDLNVILKAGSNPEFGNRIAEVIGLLTSGPASQALVSQVRRSLQVAGSTQVLHIVIPPTAYKDLDFSPVGSSDESNDRKNYGEFAASSGATMPPGTAAQFKLNNVPFVYDFWRTWNIAVTDQFPPLASSRPNRKRTGPNDAAQKFLDPKFGDDSAMRINVGVTMNAASEFMNLCEDLNRLCGDNEIDPSTWQSFADRLGKIANKDVALDFIVPTVLSLTQLCGSGMPDTTVGPAPGLSADTSIGVTMTFSEGAANAPAAHAVSASASGQKTD
jgi:hypothetical protein